MTETRLLSELRVNELRSELEKRNLDKNGIKVILTERLEKALKAEGENPATFRFAVESDKPDPEKKEEGTDKEKENEAKDQEQTEKKGEPQSKTDEKEKKDDDRNVERSVWVKGLKSGTKAAELKAAFSVVGDIQRTKIFAGKKLSAKGECLGYVTMVEESAVPNIISKLNGTTFQGVIITVTKAVNSDSPVVKEKEKEAPPKEEIKKEKPKHEEAKKSSERTNGSADKSSSPRDKQSFPAKRISSASNGHSNGSGRRSDGAPRRRDEPPRRSFPNDNRLKNVMKRRDEEFKRKELELQLEKEKMHMQYKMEKLQREKLEMEMKVLTERKRREEAEQREVAGRNRAAFIAPAVPARDSSSRRYERDRPPAYTERDVARKDDRRDDRSYVKKDARDVRDTRRGLIKEPVTKRGWSHERKRPHEREIRRRSPSPKRWSERAGIPSSSVARRAFAPSATRPYPSSSTSSSCMYPPSIWKGHSDSGIPPSAYGGVSAPVMGVSSWAVPPSSSFNSYMMAGSYPPQSSSWSEWNSVPDTKHLPRRY